MAVVTTLGRADGSMAINGRANTVISAQGRFQPLPGVTDSFTDDDGVLLENHTPDVGSAWGRKVWPISATIVGNQLERTTHLFASLYVLRALPSGGHVMTMEVIQDGVAGRVGFITHFDANRFYFGTYIGNTMKYEIVIVNPGFVTLVSLVEAAPTEPWTLEMRVRYGDDDLVLLANGVEKLRSSNDDLSGGQSGIYIHGFSDTAILDDFRLIERHGRVQSTNGRAVPPTTTDGRDNTTVAIQGRS